MLNCSPGGTYVPLMMRDASLMLCTRGWPGWKYVVKEEIFSFGSVFFAMSVVNVGWVAFVVTVAVRASAEPPSAVQTSLRIDASSSSRPATCALTVGVRPEKVTTASLASTSASAFFAAACTIDASFLSSARGVMRPVSSAVSTTAGASCFGVSVKDFSPALTVTGPDTARSPNSALTRASSSAVTFVGSTSAATSTVESPGHQRRTASAVPSTSVRVPVTGSLTVTLPPAREMDPSTGSASSSPRESSSGGRERGVVDGDDGRLGPAPDEVVPHVGRRQREAHEAVDGRVDVDRDTEVGGRRPRPSRRSTSARGGPPTSDRAAR